MGSLEEISPEQLALIKQKAEKDPSTTRPVRKRSKGGRKTYGTTTGVGQEYEYAGTDCDYCGWCDNPGNCVWSISCPRCGAEPKEHCKGSDGRLTGLHQERWDQME